MKSIVERINEKVNQFKEWAKSIEQVKEWEVDFSDWVGIYYIFEELISKTNFIEWDEETINNVLYLISRDNESERLIGFVTRENPECLIYLSKKGMNYFDYEARWQLAHYLSEIYNSFPEVEEIILRYFYDLNEYVKRRAYLALGYINSKYLNGLSLQIK